MRGAAAALFAALLVVGMGVPTAASTAAPGEDTPEQPTDPQQARERFAALVDLIAGEARQSGSNGSDPVIDADARLHRFGDVDGDGMDDILVSNWTRDGRLYTVRSGADPTEVLAENHEIDSRGWVSVGDDLDGDGIRDLTVRAWDRDRTGERECAAVACASAEQETWGYTFSLLSGAGFETTWEETFTREETGTSAGAYPPEAYARASASGNDGYTWLRTGREGSGTLMVVERTETEGSAFGSAPEAFGIARGEDVDLALTMAGADGTARGTATFDDPHRSAFTRGLFDTIADIDGDDASDGVVVDVASVQGYAYATVNETAAGTPRPALQTDVVVVSGSDASEVWRVEREPTVGSPLGAWPVGDLDGDGGEEVYLAEILATTDGDFQYRHTVLSGADGSVVASTNTTDLALFAPFGDADGTGGEEMLRASAADGYTLDTLSVVDASMEAIWSVDASDLTQLPDLRFTDWTGDGTADLAMVHGSDPGTFMVHDGPTGDAAWARTLGDDTLETAVLPDATGAGGFDLYHLVADADDGNTTAAVDDGNFTETRARLTLVAGENGDEVWTQTVVDPERDGDHDLSSLDLDLAGVGDVDGDGGADVAVRIEGGYRSVVVTDSVSSPRGGGGAAQDGDGEGNGTDEGDDPDPLERTFVLSGTTGEVHWVDPDLAADQLPEPERDQDDLGDAEPTGADPQVPGPSAAVVAAAAAAAALLVRRRRR